MLLLGKTFYRNNTTTDGGDTGGNDIIIDDELSNISPNALENRVIEDTFQKTILATSIEPLFKLPHQTLSYRRHSVVVNSLSGVQPNADIIFTASNTAPYSGRFLLIKNEALSDTGLLEVHFRQQNKLVYLTASQLSTVFGTKVRYMQRLFSMLINTTPDATLINIPDGYTLFKSEESIFRSFASGSSIPARFSFNMTMVGN